MKDLSFNPLVIHNWSRTHCGLHNYLKIEESITYKMDYKTAIKLSPGNVKQDLKQYEIEGLSKESKPLSFDYLRDDAMSPSNVATNKYKYFLIEFVNGTSIICSSYEEFLKIIETK